MKCAFLTTKIAARTRTAKETLLKSVKGLKNSYSPGPRHLPPGTIDLHLHRPNPFSASSFEIS